MNENRQQIGFFGRLGGDFRSTRTYLGARGRIKKLSDRKQATLGELSASYLEIGRQAEQAGACVDLPAFAPVKDARGKLTDAQDSLAQRQQTASSAREALDAATKEHAGIIAELDGQYQPLAQKQSAAANELSAARKALADVEGRLAKAQSELSSLGAVSGDALDALQSRLGEANQARGQIQTDMSAAQRAMHEVLTASQAAAKALAHGQKDRHREETHLQAELSAAQALQTPDKEQKVAAAKENLERLTAENDRRIAELQDRSNQAGRAYQEQTSRFESVRAQLAGADEKVRTLETAVRAKQLAGQIAEFESTLAQSQEKADQAGKAHDQARSLADAKAAELAAAKEKWNQVKSAREGELAAANNAQTQADQAVQAAQAPLSDAQRAFGQAIYESPARPQALDAEISKAKGLLATVAEIDADTTQQQIILDANRYGAKRTLIIGLSALGILLLLIAGVVILVACLSGGKKDEKKPPATAPTGNRLVQPASGDITVAPQVLPAQTLTNPGGASVQIPRRQVLENSKLDWSKIDTPPELQEIPLSGPVMCLNVYDSLVIAGKSTVELPAGADGKGVLVRDHSGLWIPLPAQQVDVAGEKILRVVVDSQPAPWIFAVVKHHMPDRPTSNPLSAGLLGLLRREWTDKSVKAEEAERLNLIDDPARPPAINAAAGCASPQAERFGVCGMAAAGIFPQIQYSTEETATLKKMVQAYSSIYFVKQVYSASGAIAAETRNAAFDKYVRALELLSEIRKEPRDRLEKIIVPFWDSPPSDAYAKLMNKSLYYILQHATANYAPWGVDVTLKLLTGVHGAKQYFDPRVLASIGQLKFIDLPLPAGFLPADVVADKTYQKEIAGYEDGKPGMQLSIRLFSSRCVNWDWYPWLLDFADNVVMRWGPVLWGAGHYIITGGAGGPAGAMLVLAGLAWAMIETCIDEAQADPNTTAERFMQVQYETVLGGDAAPALVDMMIIEAGGTIKIGNMTFKADANALRISGAQLFIAAALAYAMKNEEMGLLKRVSNIPVERTGYLGRKIPPICFQLLAEGWSKLPDPDSDSYRRYRLCSLSWVLDFKRACKDDLDKTLCSAGIESELAKPADNWINLPFASYRQAQAVNLGGPPHEQYLRLGLPRQAVEEIMKERGIAEKWDKAPIESLKLKLSVTTSKGQALFEVPAAEVTQDKEADSRLARFLAVRMHRKGDCAAPPEFAVVPKPFKCDSRAIEPPLRCKYIIQVFRQTGDSDRFEPITKPLAIELDAKEGNKPGQRKIARFDFLGSPVSHDCQYFDAGLARCVEIKADVKPSGVAHYEEYYNDDPKEGKNEEFDFILLPPDQFFAIASKAKGSPLTDEEKKSAEDANARLLYNLTESQLRFSLMKLFNNDHAKVEQCASQLAKAELWILFHGTYVSYRPKGKKDYQCQYVEGIRNGESVKYHPENEKISKKGNFKANVEEGLWEEFDIFGRLTNATMYEKGKAVSVYPKSYHPNGKLAEDGPKKVLVPGNSYPDRKEGPWTSYYEDGKMSGQGQFSKGKETGLWRAWSKGGALILETDYYDPPRGDLRSYNKVFDRNGSLEEEGGYDLRGQKHGTWRELRGTTRYTVEYDHGRQKSAKAEAPKN